MSIFEIDIPKELQAEMDAEAREDSQGSNAYIYKQYGGFNQFLLVHGLRIWNQDHVEEGQAIATAMRRADEQEAREAREARQQQQRAQAQQRSQLQAPRAKRSRPSASTAANPSQN